MGTPEGLSENSTEYCGLTLVKNYSKLWHVVYQLAARVAPFKFLPKLGVKSGV
jgi:hypothetical protein